MVWELIFMMVVLKLPVVYLCAVVWWAVRAEPRPLEGAAVAPRDGGPEPLEPHRARLRARLRPRPGSGPARRHAPARRAALVRAQGRR